jgi:tetratricopeptide (TPR) repeat protein
LSEIRCLASADGTVGLRDAVTLLAAETTRRRPARPISLETVITLARRAERENILRESAACLLAWAARRTLHDRDDPVAAASLAFEAAQIQEEIGSSAERAQTLLILTPCLLALGQVQEAADAAEAAHWAAREAINGPSGRTRTGCKSSGWPGSPSHPLECDAQAMQAWAGCLRALGDVRSAERLLDVAVASSARAISVGGSPALLASLLVDRGTWLVSSSAADAGDAERALELAADACMLTDPGSPERRHARILSAHALLALGRHVEARSIVNHLMGPVLHQIGLLSRDGLDLLDRLAVLGREWRMDELNDAAEWATQVRSALGDLGPATKG